MLNLLNMISGVTIVSFKNNTTKKGGKSPLFLYKPQGINILGFELRHWLQDRFQKVE